jgi:hypothetical protein
MQHRKIRQQTPAPTPAPTALNDPESTVDFAVDIILAEHKAAVAEVELHISFIISLTSAPSVRSHSIDTDSSSKASKLALAATQIFALSWLHQQSQKMPWSFVRYDLQLRLFEKQLHELAGLISRDFFSSNCIMWSHWIWYCPEFRTDEIDALNQLLFNEEITWVPTEKLKSFWGGMHAASFNDIAGDAASVCQQWRIRTMRNMQ